MENMTQLEYVVRGVKRLNDKPTQARLPITLELLGQLRQAWFAELEEGCCGLQQQCALLGFCEQGKLSAQQTPALTLAFI